MYDLPALHKIETVDTTHYIQKSWVISKVTDLVMHLHVENSFSLHLIIMEEGFF